MTEAGEQIVLMPGMDGTGRLFAPLLAEMPEWMSASVVSYPLGEKLTWLELQPFVHAAIPPEGSFTLIAESFSGPLALQIASQYPERLRALVLCNSFVSNPLPRYLRWLCYFFSPALFNLPVPKLAVRLALAEMTSPAELIELIIDGISRVSPQVMTQRLRLVLETDASSFLSAISQPVLYLKAERDRLITRRSSAEICHLKPEVQVIEIDGPHLLLQCSPRKSVEIIADFLQNLRGSQSAI